MLQNWKMLKFFMSEMLEIGYQNDCLEGTFVIKHKIDYFAEKLVSKFLSNI
jgi:hypothetical protein